MERRRLRRLVVSSILGPRVSASSRADRSGSNDAVATLDAAEANAAPSNDAGSWNLPSDLSGVRPEGGSASLPHPSLADDNGAHMGYGLSVQEADAIDAHIELLHDRRRFGKWALGLAAAFGLAMMFIVGAVLFDGIGGVSTTIFAENASGWSYHSNIAYGLTLLSRGTMLGVVAFMFQQTLTTGRELLSPVERPSSKQPKDEESSVKAATDMLSRQLEGPLQLFERLKSAVKP